MSREKQIQLLMDKTVDPGVFDFDRLTAPPLLSLISPDDLQYLQYLANSLKLNAKLDFKYQEIDKVMRSRGFEKIGSGTNRVTYKHLEIPNICLKIAASRSACSDSPREMINQEYLKPFVAKVFEVDPTGTVAVCERVDPIRNREEFMMIVYEVFDLVSQWFTGRYVVDDIGTNCFMNWGTRLSNGFPLLLDYPYFYPLDPHKLVCQSILPTGEVCCGEIDYDAGYNYLSCSKCGRVYKAVELAAAQKNNSILIKQKGMVERMKVKVVRGNDIVKEFDFGGESKKLIDRYADAEDRAKRARVHVVRNGEYVDRLNKIDEEAAKEEEKVSKVKVVSESEVVIDEDGRDFDTDSKFIPKEADDNTHEDNEVVVEESPLIAGAGAPQTEPFSDDNEDGVIDKEEDDVPYYDENASLDDNIASAVKAAIEETKNDVVDFIDEAAEVTIDNTVDEKDIEDTVASKFIATTPSNAEEEEPAKDTEAPEVTDDTAIKEEDKSSKKSNGNGSNKRSKRFDPNFYRQS